MFGLPENLAAPLLTFFSEMQDTVRFSFIAYESEHQIIKTRFLRLNGQISVQQKSEFLPLFHFSVTTKYLRKNKNKKIKLYYNRTHCTEQTG